MAHDDLQYLQYPLVLTNSLLLKIAINIEHFPIKLSMVIFHRYVSLPEGSAYVCLMIIKNKKLIIAIAYIQTQPCVYHQHYS